MKHMTIDYHFIRDQVQSSALCVTQVSSVDQLADVLTKLLPTKPLLRITCQDWRILRSSILMGHIREFITIDFLYIFKFL